jgi:hypothetical protein
MRSSRAPARQARLSGVGCRAVAFSGGGQFLRPSGFGSAGYCDGAALTSRRLSTLIAISLFAPLAPN